MSIITCVAISGVSSMSSSSTYHHVASRNCASSLSGRKRSGCARKPVSDQICVQPLAVALVAGALAGELQLDQLLRHDLEQAEVEERDAAVASSMKLPGCGSPENWWWRYMQPKKKRKTISPIRSRVAWSISFIASKPAPSDELRDDHLLARQAGDDVGDDDERVAAEDPRQRALVLRLELVVELLADPRADLLGGRLDVEPGRDLLHQPQDHPQVLHVGPHRLGDAGVLRPSPRRRGRRAGGPGRPGRSRRRRPASGRTRRTSPSAARPARTRSPCACRRSAPSARRRAACRACAGTPRGTPRARGRRRGS